LTTFGPADLHLDRHREAVRERDERARSFDSASGSIGSTAPGT
jgi:hypothetical protein